MKSKCIYFLTQLILKDFLFKHFLGGGLGRVSVANTNFEEDPDGIRNAFKRFLSCVLSHVNDSRDQEELSIIE